MASLPFHEDEKLHDKAAFRVDDHGCQPAATRALRAKWVLPVALGCVLLLCVFAAVISRTQTVPEPKPHSQTVVGATRPHKHGIVRGQKRRSASSSGPGGCYLVKLKPGSTLDDTERLEAQTPGHSSQIFTIVLEGFVKCGLSKDSVRTLKSNSRVASVTPHKKT
eukprot:CAMPEP_0175827600 /NCGR_PEP_ID=MMETSP0107_2-20121207/12368_1 /TAXON_ID=195067 ORGANISM="Goniomonas pacifica, Strain CCMP1869" /NCGR_SAMPLE_ID=MMETSP0107_2 /ASSEMBLY_ACC=CAM_ASM_000203 /LENGTH=164 /DNA_ID=CAMNT_0017140283 /DNA_START=6 /DNA_END=500 /DNA_ORIENTATION=+